MARDAAATETRGSASSAIRLWESAAQRYKAGGELGEARKAYASIGRLQLGQNETREAARSFLLADDMRSAVAAARKGANGDYETTNLAKQLFGETRAVFDRGGNYDPAKLAAEFERLKRFLEAAPENTGDTMQRRELIRKCIIEIEALRKKTGK